MLALDAMLLWGGSFPFLPTEVQTWELLSNFYLLQSLAFGGTFLISMLTAYLLPGVTRRALILVSAAPVSLGSLCLVATLHLPGLAMPLVCVSALLLGAGCASLLVLWQRFFASLPAERGNRCLIVGTGLAALIYLVLEYALHVAQHFVPIAFSALLVPLVFVPLGGFSLVLSTRSMDLAQPMFEDVPRCNRRVYRNTVRAYATSALCVGCLGLASGVARALVLTDPSLGATVNTVAMFGALISSLTLLALWRRGSFRFDVLSAFRIAFPFTTTGFLVLPFFGPWFLPLFSGALYMVFAFSVMIMMIQCSQASRDFGINPQFIYGFFAAVVYGLQSLGFVLGTWSRGLEMPETVQSQHVLLIALGAVWVLALTLFAARGKVDNAYALLRPSPSKIEFLQETMPVDAGPVAEREERDAPAEGPMVSVGREREMPADRESAVLDAREPATADVRERATPAGERATVDAQGPSAAGVREPDAPAGEPTAPAEEPTAPGREPSAPRPDPTPSDRVGPRHSVPDTGSNGDSTHGDGCSAQTTRAQGLYQGSPHSPTSPPVPGSRGRDTSAGEPTTPHPAPAPFPRATPPHPDSEPSTQAAGGTLPTQNAEGQQGYRHRSDLSRQFALLQQRYLLSLRELEVVELVARGNSVASIADRLVVTENTVRTHMKRIYNKLAIHKRQELLDLLEILE